MRDPYDPSQPEKSFLVDFIAAHKILVIAEISQEPTKFPQGFGRAIEAALEEATLVFSGLQDGESQHIKRPMRMPAEEDSINTDQKCSF